MSEETIFLRYKTLTWGKPNNKKITTTEEVLIMCHWARDSVFTTFLNFKSLLSIRYLVMSTEQTRKLKVRGVTVT